MPFAVIGRQFIAMTNRYSNNNNIKWQVIQMFQQRLCRISCCSIGQMHLLMVPNLTSKPQLRPCLFCVLPKFMYIFHIVVHFALCKSCPLSPWC